MYISWRYMRFKIVNVNHVFVPVCRLAQLKQAYSCVYTNCTVSRLHGIVLLELKHKISKHAMHGLNTFAIID